MATVIRRTVTETVATFSPARLRARRVAAGVSRQELADYTARGLSTIGLWERGKVTPHLRTLAIIAEGLGCTVEDLCEPPTTRRSRR